MNTPPPTADDFRYMSRALQLAGRGLYTTDPNPRVGCVIVNDGDVVGEGWHAVAGGPHAEVNALRQAGERARGATAYVSLEPCCHHGRTPPCSDALLAAGVTRVVAAMEDPNPRVAGQGLRQLASAGVAVTCGVLETAALALNPGFAKRMREGLPWVRIKMAMSLDGRTAMASGESQWITGAAARRDVQRLRARSSAILTGSGTVLADDPSLTVRAEELGEAVSRQPLRVIVDSSLRIPAHAHLLGLPGKTLIAAAGAEMERQQALHAAGAKVAVYPGVDGKVDLTAVLRHLAGVHAVNEVHVEAGATLNGALLQAGLVDELVIYMAPVLLGDAARGLFRLPGLEQMAQRLKMEIRDIRPVGDDWRITVSPSANS